MHVHTVSELAINQTTNILQLEGIQEKWESPENDNVVLCLCEQIFGKTFLPPPLAMVVVVAVLAVTQTEFEIQVTPTPMI